MLNTSLADADHLATQVLPIGTEYPPGYLLRRHEHRRAQLLYGAKGVMRLDTDEGSWIVPEDRAALIPPGMPHEVLMDGVTTWSLYIEPAAVPWWPEHCEVIEVNALLRELLRAANALPLEYEVRGRDGSLIDLVLHELRAQTPLPFHITVPHEEPFRGLCQRYLEAPHLAIDNRAWAAEAAMSPRSFDRHFVKLTGSTPAAWRARARLLASLGMLRHESVTDVSATLGYQSPAAFSAAFSQVFGQPPSSFQG
ncbi:helix-turn-helix transcriptional regulator [Leucobacter sp. UCMA 4100]|uniref:AraC family transcriptional regulator n=1 Tax=Leucobacter sp. UCMA 4100 TaxID=2810534 RepID=UPI0022EB3DCD|nr:helix-turn-helix transcriptional regulator [Leucobacter sp. UCMA 4100]MDA3147617.1 helix-turn-helix transcriptional regulator [Leucobacter sp. UCMA 4100]